MSRLFAGSSPWASQVGSLRIHRPVAFPTTGNVVTDQANGTLIKPGFNVCTGNLADSLTMPPAVGSGRVYHIKNNSANFHVLYPAPGAQFSNFGANAGYAVFPLQVFSVVDTDTNQFDIISNLPLMYPIFFFAARAGGGQALATQLGYGTNVITTCATAADSVKMPIALGGTQPTVVTNYGAASCRIHAASNGYLNNVLNGTYDLAPGKTATFWDTGPLPQNTWSGGAFA